MSLLIRPAEPTHSDFFGEVEGIDLGQPVDRETVAAIEAGLDRFAILVFHDQRLDDAKQLAFGRNFGVLEQATYGVGSRFTPRRITAFAIRTLRNNLKRLRRHPGARQPQRRRLEGEIEDISNLDRYNQLWGRNDPRRLLTLRNMFWHSDSSFKPTPAKYSLLHARVIPLSGGNTEFADMRGAYDALDNGIKETIQNLICEHSQMYSWSMLGLTDFSDEERVAWAPVPQRLVRRHPVTGRRSLFLSAHAGGIVGWPTPEARVLLHDLTEHATQREFVHVHRWRPYDLVMWDNRVVMHRARRFNDTNDVRELHRVTVSDVGPSLQHAAA
jgi:alpha-ketoglutarate-dependent 2,4-dichlorophenoxyacetate dioxygenase